jgi:hypothetical protein
MRASSRSPLGQQIMADEARFIDPATRQVIVVTEERVIVPAEQSVVPAGSEPQQE